MQKRKPKSKFQMYYGATENIQNNAKKLRLNQTKAEKVLWNELRNKKLNGCKFRRQHPVMQFIADFYCHEKKLIIEVDGGIHNIAENKEYDINRTYELNRFDIKVLRFTNEQVLHDLEFVLNKIREELN